MMELWLWDVQHGSAAFLKTPAGRNIVVDLGIGDISRGDSAFSPLRHLHDGMGVRQIDELVITHPHRDHLDDIGQLFNVQVFRRPTHLSAETVRAGNRSREMSVVEEYLRMDEEFRHPVADSQNLALAANTGMGIERFQPTQCPLDKLNDHSIVSFFTHCGLTVCMPGDNESPSWRELLHQVRFQNLLRRTDIFVASHHGREAGFCADVFEYCFPKLVIVSDGPASDTSAIAKYSAKASGWEVHSLSRRSSSERKVLTTRSDGSVRVRVFADFGSDSNVLEVSVE